MNKFNLVIQVSDEDGHIFFREDLTTKSLVELMSKLLITNARLTDKLIERKIDEDDIPF